MLPVAPSHWYATCHLMAARWVPGQGYVEIFEEFFTWTNPNLVSSLYTLVDSNLIILLINRWWIKNLCKILYTVNTRQWSKGKASCRSLNWYLFLLGKIKNKIFFISLLHAKCFQITRKCTSVDLLFYCFV